MDTVRFESEPPGAEVKTTNNQTCRTPCALALPVNGPMSATFRLNGYQPETETMELITTTGSPPQLRPNPVFVELTAAPPPPKPVKKHETKKKTSAAPKPAARPRPPAAAAPAPAAMTQPVQQQPAPWPAPPPQQR